MSLTTHTTAYRDVKTALRVNTSRLTRDERSSAILLAQQFTERLEVELWMDEMGIDVPGFGTEAWAAYEREYKERLT